MDKPPPPHVIRKLLGIPDGFPDKRALKLAKAAIAPEYGTRICGYCRQPWDRTKGPCPRCQGLCSECGKVRNVYGALRLCAECRRNMPL